MAITLGFAGMGASRYCSEHGGGAICSDFGLFISGALFTTDYLVEAIKATAAYRAVDVAGLRVRLDQIAAAFPQNPARTRARPKMISSGRCWPRSAGRSRCANRI